MNQIKQDAASHSSVHDPKPNHSPSAEAGWKPERPVSSCRVLAFVLLALLAAPSPGRGQTADTYVTQGRTLLAAHDLMGANSNFAAAVRLSPVHAHGNVLWAGTRLLTLPTQPAGMALLDRLGFAPTNRSLYDWTAMVPQDTNGMALAPTNMSAAELSAFLRTNVLVALTAAGTNLAAVTDHNYLLSLTSNETSTVAVTLDYGDLQMLRAGLKFLEYVGYTVHSWNADVQLTAIRSLFTNGPGTAQSFLAQNPALLTFATTNDLAAARLAFSNAVTLYLNASDFIRNRPANVTRLFNYEPDMAQDENNFRVTLTELQQSLSHPTVLTINTNLTVNLRNHFTGAKPPRAFLPQLAGNRAIAGTLPDPSFGGILQGLAAYQVEDFLGNYRSARGHSEGSDQGGVAFVSRFRSPQHFADGRIQVVLDALEGSLFLIQVSSDLQSWIDLTVATVQQGTLSFVEPPSAVGGPRFYRALDLTASATVEGTVVDLTTGNPVPHASVGLAPNNWPYPWVTIETDDSGEFLAFLPGDGTSYYGFVLTVTAPGYAAEQLSSYFHYHNPHATVPVYLAPIGYAPPNDNFAQRVALTGPNNTVSSFNVGATAEPWEAHVGQGLTVWWSWTAPANGAVTIDTAGSSFATALAVSTGDWLWSLTQVGTDYNSGGNGISRLNFFVTAGTTYQIAVDSAYGSYPGRVVLNVHMTTPEPPTFRSQPSAQRMAVGYYVYFSADVSGTAPMFYQWRRNGIPIPGATDPYFQVYIAQTNQAGAYSVVVTNAAGRATSSDAALTVYFAPPQFYYQPQLQNVLEGGYVSFSVGVSGSPPLAYQWRKDGVNIAGATTSYYAIDNAQISQSGNYSVVVSNVAASVVSANAHLTVYSPDQARIIGVSGTLAFGSVQASQTATQVLTINNHGYSPLTVSSVSYPAGFSGAWTGTIQAGGSQNIPVVFAPLAQTTYGGTVTVDSDATSGTNTDAVSGTGYWPLTNRWTLWWQNTNGSLALWTMNGESRISSASLNPPNSGAGWSVMGTADMNRDGQADLIFESASGQVAAWMMNGTNRLSSSYLTPGQTTPSWQIQATGDLDGSGQRDLLWQSTDGSLSTWLMNGLVSTQSVRLNPGSVSPGWKLVGSGDFNRDSRTDLVLQSTNGLLAVWFMSGTNRVGTAYLNPPQVDPSWKIVGTMDFNGDGHTGLIWRQDSGALSYWEMDGTNRVHAASLSSSPVDPAWKVVGPR
jgi:hypothetical protein